MGRRTCIAARSKLSAGEALSIADLIALTKQTTMADASLDAVARRRYEQARPRTAVHIDFSLLDRYVGHFRFEDNKQVGTVTRNGDRLFAKLLPAMCSLRILITSAMASGFWFAP